MPDKKVALFAFTGDASCFVHVMLNGLEFKRRGFDVKIVIEGAATKLIKDLPSAKEPVPTVYKRIQDEGLLDCVCQACANMMTTLEAAKGQGLPLCAEMSGHPSMARYMEQGYTVITF